MKTSLYVCLLVLTSVSSTMSHTGHALRKGVSVEMVVTTNASPMPEADLADAWIVTVTESGSLYFGVDPVTAESLAVAMKSRPRKHEQKLYIKADARAPFAAVKKVLEAARADLFQTAVLLTSQPSPSKQGRIVAPQGLEVLVRASSSGSEDTVLRLTHSGQQSPLLELNDKETSMADLRGTLEQTLQNRSDRAVLVKAEGELSFTQVVQAIDVCRSAGAGVVLATAE
jgi:biopolymer transport protein ExbD